MDNTQSNLSSRGQVAKLTTDIAFDSARGLRCKMCAIQLGVSQEVGSAAGSLNAGAELSEEGGVSQFRVQDKTGKQTIISINTVWLCQAYFAVPSILI